MGLGINNKINYCCIKYNENYYYLAEKLIEDNFKKDSYEIFKKNIKGSDIIKKYSYQPIFEHFNIVIPLAAAPYPAIFFPCLIKFITKFLSLLLTS